LTPSLRFRERNVFLRGGVVSRTPNIQPGLIDWLIEWLAFGSRPNGAYSPRPHIPTWKIRVSLFSLGQHVSPVRHGRSYQQLHYHGIALRGIWPIKPHHYIKVGLLYECSITPCTLLWHKCTRLAFYWIATDSVSREQYHQRPTKLRVHQDAFGN
jgi:hypothetical protein